MPRRDMHPDVAAELVTLPVEEITERLMTLPADTAEQVAYLDALQAELDRRGASSPIITTIAGVTR